MPSLFPSSVRKGIRASLALTAAALVALTGSDTHAKKSHAKDYNKRATQLTVSVDLIATPEAPAEATGTAEIRLREKRSCEKTKLKVDVNALPAGTYSVDVVATGSELPVHIETFAVEEAPVAPAKYAKSKKYGRSARRACKSEAELEITLPSTLDARTIETITVSSVPADNTTTATVLLTGDVTSPAYLRFFSQVCVTAPPASALTASSSPASYRNGGKPQYKNYKKDDDDDCDEDEDEDEDEDGDGRCKTRKIQGRALVANTVENGVETKRFFHFIASGAPASASLNIVVNGETVGQVTSTKKGCVKFCELPETVDLTTIDLVIITDANGVALMQADF